MPFSIGIQAPTRLAFRGGEADVTAQETAAARKVGNTLAYRRRCHISELLRDHVIQYNFHNKNGRATTKEIRSITHKLTQKAVIREAKSIPSSAELCPGSQFVLGYRRPCRTTSTLDIEFKGGAQARLD